MDVHVELPHASATVTVFLRIPVQGAPKSAQRSKWAETRQALHDSWLSAPWLRDAMWAPICVILSWCVFKQGPAGGRIEKNR